MFGQWLIVNLIYTTSSLFQNLPPDAIFCDHASDMYHEWHSVVFVMWHVEYMSNLIYDM